MGGCLTDGGERRFSDIHRQRRHRRPVWGRLFQYFRNDRVTHAADADKVDGERQGCFRTDTMDATAQRIQLALLQLFVDGG